MRRDIVTTLIIPAPRTAVWDTLADLSGWAGWNPMASLVNGQLETGSRLHLRLDVHGRRQQSVYPEVLRVLPAEELSWMLRLWLPGLLDCEHRWQLETPEDGDREQTLLMQSARLSGILLPVFWRRLRPAITDGFHQSNRGLREALLSRPCP